MRFVAVVPKIVCAFVASYWFAAKEEPLGVRRGFFFVDGRKAELQTRKRLASK